MIPLMAASPVLPHGVGVDDEEVGETRGLVAVPLVGPVSSWSIYLLFR